MLLAVNFHYIRENFDAPYPAIFGITPSQFRSQLELLAKLGTFVSASDIANQIEKDEIFQKKSIVITFDDGLQEQFDLAKPILDEMGIPAIYFINTKTLSEKILLNVHRIHLVRSLLSPDTILENLIKSSVFKSLRKDKRNKIQELGSRHYIYDSYQNAYLKYLLNFVFLPEEVDREFTFLLREICNVDEIIEHKKLYMSLEAINSLAKSDSIGSHAHDHIPLGTLPKEKINFQIHRSREILNELQITSKAFSYPYGSKEAVGIAPQLLKEHGFTFAFTMERGLNLRNYNSLKLKRYDNNDVPGGKAYSPNHPIPHFEL
jgi:peptidoglycan/xylan/chitin deacetylase (PgdA/CDA1 family)